MISSGAAVVDIGVMLLLMRYNITLSYRNGRAFLRVLNFSTAEQHIILKHEAFNMNVNERHTTSYHGKVIVMILFLIMDLGLNCILDYDVLNDERPNNILLGVFGLQVVIQISIFLILFLAMADTYLFRVGLLGIIVRTISFVLVLHAIYMALTIATGSYRVRHLSRAGKLSTLWKDDNFIALSIFQKIGTVVILYGWHDDFNRSLLVLHG